MTTLLLCKCVFIVWRFLINKPNLWAIVFVLMSHARSNGIMGGLRGTSAANNGFINLGRTSGAGFSIRDAFEEEEDADEMIKVYGNNPTTTSKPNEEGGAKETRYSILALSLQLRLSFNSHSNCHIC